jgi:dolichol-phosphate mannosyltransferase
LANLLYDARITDEATCYKVIKADLLKDIKLRCEGFEFCPEITAKLRKKGHRILEVPIYLSPPDDAAGKEAQLDTWI